MHHLQFANGERDLSLAVEQEGVERAFIPLCTTIKAGLALLPPVTGERKESS